MKSRNTRAPFVFHKTPVVTKDAVKEARVISATLKAADLALEDDADNYCDPYNSTGKHVILKATLRKQLRD